MKSARAITSAIALVSSVALGGSALAQEPSGGGVSRVVFQVSDSDPGKWSLTLNNVQNLQQELGTNKVVVEVVAYGPGIAMLKQGSPAGERVTRALRDGVSVVACQNTMRAMGLTERICCPESGTSRPVLSK